MSGGGFAADTDPEAVKVQLGVLRRIGLEGRAAMTFELCDNLREIVRAGIRRRHPDYDDAEILRALLRLTAGGSSPSPTETPPDRKP
ncbi:MAG: hypothetical protein AB1486_18420 [Planctomycetota bacterium]